MNLHRNPSVLLIEEVRCLLCCLWRKQGKCHFARVPQNWLFLFYSCRRKTAGAKEIPVKRKHYHPEHRRLSDILIFHLLCAFPLSDIYHLVEVYGIPVPFISRFENTGIVKATNYYSLVPQSFWEKCQVLFSEGEGVRCAALTSVQSIYELHSSFGVPQTLEEEKFSLEEEYASIKYHHDIATGCSGPIVHCLLRYVYRYIVFNSPSIFGSEAHQNKKMCSYGPALWWNLSYIHTAQRNVWQEEWKLAKLNWGSCAIRKCGVGALASSHANK